MDITYSLLRAMSTILDLYSLSGDLSLLAGTELFLPKEARMLVFTGFPFPCLAGTWVDVRSRCVPTVALLRGSCWLNQLFGRIC